MSVQRDSVQYYMPMIIGRRSIHPEERREAEEVYRMRSYQPQAPARKHITIRVQESGDLDEIKAQLNEDHDYLVQNDEELQRDIQLQSLDSIMTSICFRFDDHEFMSGE